MNQKFLSIIAASLLISFLGCDKNNPTNSSLQLNPNAGNLKSHSDLPNDFVTESTKDSAGSLLVNSFYIPSLDDIRNSELKPYIRTNLDTTITIDTTFKVKGEHSGETEIELNGTINMNLSTEEGKIDLTASVTYYDYSNNGKIFIGGEAQSTINANSTTDQENLTVKLVGHVKFNGLYTGECKYNMTISYNKNQINYSGDMKIISDGKEYNCNIDEIK